MARPTDDKKSSSVILRINDETRRELEDKAKERGENISEYIREILRDNSVIQNKYGELSDIEAELDDIKTMSEFSSSTLSGILKNLCQKMNEGSVTIENNEIIINECPFSFDKFIEACNEKNISYEKAIDKATQMVWRG